MQKSISALFLAAALLLPPALGDFTPVYAAQQLQNAPTAAEKKMPPRGMRRPRPTNEQTAAQLSKEFGYGKQELLQYLQGGVRQGDLRTLCYYARLSGKPLPYLIKLRQQQTWERIKLAVGLTPQKLDELEKTATAEALARQTGLTVKDALGYLKRGYAAGDVRMALLLAQASGRDTDSVIALRTAANYWDHIAAQLGVSGEVYVAAQKKVGFIDNAGRRSGRGFAGLRVTNPTKEKMLDILSRDYKFSAAEMEPYYEELGFRDLEALCLYAYLARKPLAEVYALRTAYTWEGMKLALGLTPKKYYERMCEYQADRLLERMDIPRDATLKYLHKGFPMHHINMSALLERVSGVDMYSIMLLKTPGNTWNDVAAKIGVSPAECQQIKNKIEADFKR